MLHLKPRFKVKEIFHAHRGALQKDRDLELAHSFLREARGTSQADPGENGYRTYPETAAKILGLIDGAQRLGFSLSEIRAGLSEAAPNFPSRAAMVKALRSKLDHIDQHIKEVRARRRQIVKLLKEMGD